MLTQIKADSVYFHVSLDSMSRRLAAKDAMLAARDPQRWSPTRLTIAFVVGWIIGAVVTGLTANWIAP